MSTLATSAALLVTGAALLSATAALLATRSVVVALPVLLDLLLAASLLRLTLLPSYPQLAATAVLVLVKRLASSGVRRAVFVRADRGDR